MKQFVGLKDTMSQAWTKNGNRLPVTIIKADALTVVQVKTKESDGYDAVQVGFGVKKAANTTKPMAGHVAKSGINPRYLAEIESAPVANVGESFTAETVLSLGDVVNVSSEIKGRGFAGPMKHYGFHGGPKTHGQSDRWRAPGSIGQGTTPGRIYKGKHMAGRYGQEIVTVKNLQVVKIDADKKQIWLSGPIPGAKNSLVYIKVIRNRQFEGLNE